MWNHNGVWGARTAAGLMMCVVLVAAASISSAGTITTTLTPFTGSAASVFVTLDDMADPDSIVITLDVNVAPNTGDLRGFFLNISDDSLIPGLSIIGLEVTQTQFSAGAVINLGGGNNLNGGGTPCPCDIGVEIGDPGIGMGDDFQTTTFTLSHITESLDLSLFDGQDLGALGARLTSVGLPGGSRNGSSKLGGVVPEPTTGLMVAAGLGGLAIGSRRSRAIRAH